MQNFHVFFFYRLEVETYSGFVGPYDLGKGCDHVGNLGNGNFQPDDAFPTGDIARGQKKASRTDIQGMTGMVVPLEIPGRRQYSPLFNQTVLHGKIDLYPGVSSFFR